MGWLDDFQIRSDVSFVTSLPDFSEFPRLTLAEWKVWFTDTAERILSRVPDKGVALFFQTDIKHEGTWVDKAYLCQRAAENQGHALLLHKIFCRAPVGIATYGKPAYSHLVAFSRGVRAEVALSTADVLPDVGEKTWTRGTGIRPARVACEFILQQTATRTIVNPFCGEGSVLAVANALGLEAIGIEKSAKRAEKARRIQLTPDFLNFTDLDK